MPATTLASSQHAPVADDPESFETMEGDLIHLPGFHVCDEASANWVVRRVVAARRYAESVKAYATRETARAEREERFFLWRYGAELERWLDRQLADRDRVGGGAGRCKSVNLPAGTMGRRALASKLVLDNDASALAWAKRHCPDAVVVTEKLSKSALNEHFEQTGELPEGVSLTDAREVFYVK